MKGVAWPLAVTMAIQALVSMAVFSPPVFAPAAHGEIGFPASWVGVVTALTFAAATVGALTFAAAPASEAGARGRHAERRNAVDTTAGVSKWRHGRSGVSWPSMFVICGYLGRRRGRGGRPPLSRPKLSDRDALADRIEVACHIVRFIGFRSGVSSFTPLSALDAGSVNLARFRTQRREQPKHKASGAKCVLHDSHTVRR